MSGAQLRLLNAEVDRLTQFIEQEPVRFFRPSPGGQWDFMTCSDSSIRTSAFLAGNKSGKTTAACIIAAELAAGHVLWDMPGRPLVQVAYRNPSVGAFFAEDFPSHEEVTLPTFLTWFPHHLIRRLVPGQDGSIRRILCTNGTVIYLRTYDQGYRKAEGKDYDWLVFDEPPPRDVYTAGIRGLVATGGRAFIAATLLSEVWLYDESEQPHVRMFEASIYDNPWLNEQARDDFVRTLTEEEKGIRVYGKPSTLTGAIYPYFNDRPPFVVEDKLYWWDTFRDRPWPVILAIDPHERKPLHCMWAYLTPDNGLIWFDYKLVESVRGTSSIISDISAVEDSHHARASVIVLDPNRGKAKQMGGSSWVEEFEAAEWSVILGDDNLDLGHSCVRNFLRVEYDDKKDVRVPPKMVFTERCRGTNGPIHQMKRYSWDDWTRGSRMEKDLKEKPRSKNKDFPDVIRYTCMAVESGELDFATLRGDRTEPLSAFGNRPSGRLY
jgi:phage terminase large subunit-like protein